MKPTTVSPKIQVFRYFIIVSIIGSRYCTSCHSVAKVNEYYINAWEIVLFPCDDATEIDKYWKRGDTLLTIWTHIIDTQISQRFELFDNFSLSIEPVLISDEGEYSCGTNTTTVVAYKLHINGTYWYLDSNWTGNYN